MRKSLKFFDIPDLALLPFFLIFILFYFIFPQMRVFLGKKIKEMVDAVCFALLFGKRHINLLAFNVLPSDDSFVIYVGSFV